MLFLVGLGGAGCKIVDHFYKKNVVSAIINKIAGKDEDFVTGVGVDTSDKITTAKHIPRENMVLIGKSRSKGHGAGKDVALGRKIMREEMELALNTVKKAYTKKPDMIFLVAGMGGGTGTGGFDLFSKRLKKAYNVPVVGVIILPARSEGRVYNKNAFKNLEKVVNSVDGVIVFDNDVPVNMGEDILSAHRIINDTLHNFLGIVDLTMMKRFLKNVSTIGFIRKKSMQVSLKDAVEKILREKIYLTVNPREIGEILLVVYGNMNTVYGIDFAKEWIKKKYGKELQHIIHDIPNSRYTDVGLMITGIKDLSSRFEEISAEVKEKSRSELEELLGDITPLY